ncbi:MAG: chorismate mutase [Caulobacterales bacterium]|nr:chorismate mutase [Caulobacterales bacterium]
MSEAGGRRAPADCASMDDVRAEIDRLDEQLVDLLGARWGYVDRAWQLKASPDQALVPWRVQQVIDKVRARAERGGMPPALAEALWRQLIGWGIQYEEEKMRARERGA